MSEEERREGDRREWSGVERREGQRMPKGRLVYSRGPIIEWLIVAVGVAGIVSAVGLVISLSLFSTRIDTAELRLDTAHVARQHSALDTCRLFRIVIDVAGQEQPAQVVVDFRGRRIGRVLPQDGVGKRRELGRFLHATGLDDCHHYAQMAANGEIFIPTVEQSHQETGLPPNLPPPPPRGRASGR